MKGQQRERDLERSAYFSEAYFTMPQLCALSHQINHIYELRPASVLEIGIGNGFTSTFLKRAGIDVCTVDINPALAPDIVCPLNELPSRLTNKRFDLVVCCEVLEHMPFEEFQKSLEIFKLYSNNLFLTLPSYSTWFGFSGFIRVPRANRLFNIGFNLNKKKNLDNNHVHFWELGSHSETSRKNIKRLLAAQYKSIEHGAFQLNRYHEFFICKDSGLS